MLAIYLSFVDRYCSKCSGESIGSSYFVDMLNVFSVVNDVFKVFINTRSNQEHFHLCSEDGMPYNNPGCIHQRLPRLPKYDQMYLALVPAIIGY